MELGRNLWRPSNCLGRFLRKELWKNVKDLSKKLATNCKVHGKGFMKKKLKIDWEGTYGNWEGIEEGIEHSIFFEVQGLKMQS